MAKVLLGITGSIAAYKSCELISTLVKSGHEVQVVATESALKFVGPASLEGLSGKPVQSDTFERGHMMDHIHLARWADVFITAPCSLAQLSRFSNGLADNLVTQIYLALDPKIPKFIAPAMNTKMWENPQTQDLLAKISKYQTQILMPGSGSLACGEIGAGRMMEAQDIFKSLFRKTKGRVLITSGGTREAIDPVRYIGNLSTGRTASLFAEQLSDMGYNVDLLAAKSAALTTGSNITRTEFVSFQNLKNELTNLLQKNTYDCIFHMAAVSDFSVASLSSKKISSDNSFSIELQPNEKLIQKIRNQANGNPQIIGFKLTAGSTAEENINAVNKVLMDTDIVAHNRLEDISAGKHSYTLYDKNGCMADFVKPEEFINKILMTKQTPTPEAQL